MKLKHNRTTRLLSVLLCAALLCVFAACDADLANQTSETSSAVSTEDESSENEMIKEEKPTRVAYIRWITVPSTRTV